MRLSIVIPALDEEDSIEKIITRSLEARDHIIKSSDVTDVDVTVVSDGSTDRTVEIASQYKDKIHLIVFEKNKGYGAAIKQGWKESKGDLVAFLDADGTCEPLFFADLCNMITRDGADIALGSRLNKNSQMPPIRRFGNTLFSLLLSFLASERIKDTASGMRVVRRSSLSKVMPLPDGLHFTPAMSARAVLSDDLVIREKDMTYNERDGESKLNAWKDGIRFLKIILQTALLYKPNVFLSSAGFLFLLLGIISIIVPTSFYLQNQMIEEWMIYRFVFTNLLTTLSALCFLAGFVTEKIVDLTLFDNVKAVKTSWLYRIFSSTAIWIFVALFFVLGSWMIWESLVERIETGHTITHWSRYLAMSTLFSVSFVLITMKVIDYFLGLIRERVIYLQSEEKNEFS